MIRRREFALAGLSAAALTAFGSADDRRPDRKEGHDGTMFDKCAKACSDCQRECEACSTHCAKLLAKAGGHHLETLMTCRDCADLCAVSASLAARQGPFADLACRACADACAKCATACEKHGRDDKVMTHCAEECKRCEKECREMISHAVADR
ncbi:MAG TPA: four-helix bundle copper-binding protein [Planctomycetaceae bacterium]|jgi:hypothetical protein